MQKKYFFIHANDKCQILMHKNATKSGTRGKRTESEFAIFFKLIISYDLKEHFNFNIIDILTTIRILKYN